MRKIISLVLVFGIVITMFTGCALQDKFGKGSSDSDELSPVSSITMGENEANGLKDKSQVQLYFINEQGNKLSSEIRYIKTSETTKGSDYLATAILKELISGPAKGSLLKASIPKETKVHSNVIIKDGVATVDLSKEFIDKHPGGKKNEQLTIYSIVNTLTEIKDITSVKFMIDGKVKKEFKGTYQIDGAFPRTAYLISSQPADKATIKADDKEKSKDNKDTKDVKDNSAAKPSKVEENKDQNKQETPKDQKTNADVEKETEILE